MDTEARGVTPGSAWLPHLVAECVGVGGCAAVGSESIESCSMLGVVVFGLPASLCSFQCMP